MSNWHKAIQLYAANSGQDILNAQPDLWGLSKLYWAELMLEENTAVKMSNIKKIRNALSDAEKTLFVDARNKLGTLLPNSAFTAALLDNDLREANRWLKAGQKYRNLGLTDTRTLKSLYREELIEFYNLAAQTAALKSDYTDMWAWIESAQAYSRNSAFYTNTRARVDPSYVEQYLRKSLDNVEVAAGSFGLESEASNLVSAFLGKGVISALWRVEVNATALLMSKFMELHVNYSVPPARALTEAQQWLRSSSINQLSSYLQELLMDYPRSESDSIMAILVALGDNQSAGSSRPYENPYYWGGFIYLGA